MVGKKKQCSQFTRCYDCDNAGISSLQQDLHSSWSSGWYVLRSIYKSTSGKSARQEVPHETQHNRGAMFSLRHSDGGGCLMQGCRNTQRCHGLGTPKRWNIRIPFETRAQHAPFQSFSHQQQKTVPTDNTKKRSGEPRRTAWSQGCWLPSAAKKQSRKGPHRRALLASNHMPQHRHPLLSLPAALGSVRFGATRLSKWKHMKVRGSLLKNGAWMPPREFTHPEGSKPS